MPQHHAAIKRHQLEIRTAESKTECRCPRCGKTHFVMAFWTGRGILRKFCHDCYQYKEAVGIDNHQLIETCGGYGAALYTRRAGVTVTE